jgi:hypothetical protein
MKDGFEKSGLPFMNLNQRMSALRFWLKGEGDGRRKKKRLVTPG